MPPFEEGEIIIYCNGNQFEIGKIKTICTDGAFVYYSEGATASKTPFEFMHKLMNHQYITITTLGILQD